MSLIRCCCRLQPSTAKSLPYRTIPTPYNHASATNSHSRPILRTQKRTYASSSDPSPSNNPILDTVNKKKAEREKKSSTAPVLRPEQGSLAPSSLFTPRTASATAVHLPDGNTMERNPAAMSSRLDPRPADRRRWERRMVIKSIRRRGRLTRTQIIKRTEREHLAKSEFYRTSMKKLSPLARQIAGKPIEEAIQQMGFSVKKAARDVQAHLLKAHAQAVVERGMGLGFAEKRMGKPMVVKLADGKRHRIEDRTGIYVAQAWVGKGMYYRDLEKRARGRIDNLMLPQTSISVLLKEEATRIREHEERTKRAKAKKPWMPLPNRPISEQRQFYAW